MGHLAHAFLVSSLGMNAYPTHRCVECSLMRCFEPGQRCDAETCQAAAPAKWVPLYSWRLGEDKTGAELNDLGVPYQLHRGIFETDDEYRARLLRRISGEAG